MPSDPIPSTNDSPGGEPDPNSAVTASTAGDDVGAGGDKETSESGSSESSDSAAAQSGSSSTGSTEFGEPKMDLGAERADSPSDGASASAVSDDATSESAHPDDDSTSPHSISSGADDEGTAAHADAEPGPGGTEDAAQKKRKRKRKKKPTSNAPARTSIRATDRAPFHVGEEVFGKVTAVLDTAIMVDLSGKALAIFDRGEMAADDLVPAVGDRFLAHVHNDGSRGGLVVLTRKPLREEEAKPRVEEAFKESKLIEGLVTGVIKGGVEVDIDGLRAFAPASGMDLHPANANFAGLVGQRIDFRVLQFDKGGRDVVVTRRPMLEAEAHERRKHALTLLTEGQELKGIVRTVVEWGAFVALPDAENLEGLVHVSEASHDPRARLTELIKPGDTIDVKIIKIDEKGKIWLSRKALLEDPWAEAKQKFAPGSRHVGKVTRLEKFGAFVELEAGIEGLIHVADLSFDHIEHASEKLSEGQDIAVAIHHFDPRNRKISLHPAPTAERADEAPQKIVRYALVKAEVVKIESSGLIVRVLGVTGRTARGFVPAGQTGTARGTDLRKAFKVGSVLDLKVLDVDPKRGEARLSVRAFKEDEERRAHKEYRQKVKAESSFGTLGDLLKRKLNLGQETDKPND
jgi:small subunit ribosomal protein S1